VRPAAATGRAPLAIPATEQHPASGSNFGWHQQGNTECPNDDYMPAYEARATVSSCVQSSNYVVMNYSKL
jgi:hypothetical protein